jgi:hypothetical protein
MSKKRGRRLWEQEQPQPDWKRMVNRPGFDRDSRLRL